MIEKLKRKINLLILKWKYRGKYVDVSQSYVSRVVKLGGANFIGYHSKFNGRLGYGSSMGRFCHFNAIVGKFTSIANFVTCNPGIHAYKEPFATTSPMFFSTHTGSGKTFAKKQMFNEFRFYDSSEKLSIKIGNDCWIGEQVFFVGGIEIGDGAVVLARAVVTKDVPPYAIVGGVPAKVIDYRYDEETIKFLLDIQWWNNDELWFEQNHELLCDIERLKYFYKNKK